MEKQYITTLVVFLLIMVVAFLLYQKFMPKTEEENNVNPNELRSEVLQEGNGEGAKIGDTVSVHYTGTLENGVKFDSSLDRGEPFSFTLGENRVIQGWEKGVLGMKTGENRKLFIPSDLGYGEQGQGPIPPNANLIFEIELLGINQ